MAERHLGRLAGGAVSPWPGEVVADEGQARALEGLARAAGGRGLPMPGGFLLDPIAIGARVALPAPRPAWKVALAYHPRFGLILGQGSGHGRLYTIEYPGEAAGLEAPRLHEARDVGRNWDELLDWLFLLDDAQRMAYAVWIGVGEAYGDRRPMGGRWSPLRHVLYARSRDRLLGLAARLSARPPSERGGWGIHLRGREVIIVMIGADAFVACAGAGDSALALAWAGEHGLAAMPEAWGGETGYGRGEPPAEGAIYELAGVANPPAFRVTAARDADVFVWSWIQDGTVLAAQRVLPGRVSATAAALLPRASPRLLRALGRLGVSRVPALSSVEGVRRWVAETPEARGWERLVDIEEEIGGVIFGAHWGLASPDRLGAWLVLGDHESLAGLNEAEDEDGLPWPFVRRGGIELCVIGLERRGFASAICADREGAIYFLDNELMSLLPLADSVTGMLEKRALWQELWAFGSGLARAPALAIERELDADWAARVGLSPVPEASDRVSAWYVGRDAGAALVAWSARPAQQAESTLYIDGAARAVELARALRDRHPDATIYARHNQGDAADAERWGALQAAGLAGLERRDWTTWRFRSGS